MICAASAASVLDDTVIRFVVIRSATVTVAGSCASTTILTKSRSVMMPAGPAGPLTTNDEIWCSRSSFAAAAQVSSLLTVTTSRCIRSFTRTAGHSPGVNELMSISRRRHREYDATCGVHVDYWAIQVQGEERRRHNSAVSH